MVYGASKIAEKMFNAVQEDDQAAYKKHDDELGFYTPSSVCATSAAPFCAWSSHMRFSERPRVK